MKNNKDVITLLVDAVSGVVSESEKSGKTFTQNERIRLKNISIILINLNLTLAEKSANEEK